MKQLKDEELDKVTGGSIGTEGLDTKGQFSGFIDMYTLHDSSYFNKEYYFVFKQRNKFCWFKGKLINSYEAWNWFSTVCTHDIEVTESGDSENAVGRKFEPCGNSIACYTTKNY